MNSHEVTNLDPVFGLKQRSGPDLLVVHERVVAAFEVLDVVHTLRFRNLGMLAADGMVRDDDLAGVRVAADDQHVTVQWDGLARGRAAG